MLLSMKRRMPGQLQLSCQQSLDWGWVLVETSVSTSLLVETINLSTTAYWRLMIIIRTMDNKLASVYYSPRGWATGRALQPSGDLQPQLWSLKMWPDAG